VWNRGRAEAMSLGELRSAPPERFLKNYSRVIWKETAARERAAQVAAAPDPFADTQRSLRQWSQETTGQDSQRSSRSGESASGSQRRRPLTGSGIPDALSRSASLPSGHPMKAEVPATFGSGFLGKPCYFDPMADKSLFPKPEPGARLDAGPAYIPCRSAGNTGIMMWESGRSHKTASALERLERQRTAKFASTIGSAGATSLAASSEMQMPGGQPILTPPKAPPWGFGAPSARVRAGHVDFYWGC